MSFLLTTEPGLLYFMWDLLVLVIITWSGFKLILYLFLFMYKNVARFKWTKIPLGNMSVFNVSHCYCVLYTFVMVLYFQHFLNIRGKTLWQKKKKKQRNYMRNCLRLWVLIFVLLYFSVFYSIIFLKCLLSLTESQMSPMFPHSSLHPAPPRPSPQLLSVSRAVHPRGHVLCEMRWLLLFHDRSQRWPFLFWIHRSCSPEVWIC